MTIRERFWKLVSKQGPLLNPKLGRCWIWQLVLNGNGYGNFSVARKSYTASRVAFMLTHGRWPYPCCLHKCDNRACVRPSHLFEGTLQDNVDDRTKKGRGKGIPPRMFGEDNWNTKLTEEDVKNIRGSVDSQRALGRRFDVSQATIQRIKTRKVWRHIP